VKPFAATVVYDDSCLGTSFLGSAVVSANQPLVGMTNEASDNGFFKKAYSSFQGGSQTAYAALVYRTFNESGRPPWRYPRRLQRQQPLTGAGFALYD